MTQRKEPTESDEKRKKENRSKRSKGKGKEREVKTLVELREKKRSERLKAARKTLREQEAKFKGFQSDQGLSSQDDKPLTQRIDMVIFRLNVDYLNYTNSISATEKKKKDREDELRKLMIISTDPETISLSAAQVVNTEKHEKGKVAEEEVVEEKNHLLKIEKLNEEIDKLTVTLNDLKNKESSNRNYKVQLTELKRKAAFAEKTIINIEALRERDSHFSQEAMVDRWVIGPHNLTEATKDLQNIVNSFMDDSKDVLCKYNIFGELEVQITNKADNSNEKYNLTQILESGVDFSHLQLEVDLIPNYEAFLTQSKPSNLYPNDGEVFVPHYANFFMGNTRLEEGLFANVIDPDGDFSHLTTAHKMAIWLYTMQEFFPYMQSFLRTHGRNDGFGDFAPLDSEKKRDESTFKNTMEKNNFTNKVKQVLLAIALSNDAIKIPSAKNTTGYDIDFMPDFEMVKLDLCKIYIKKPPDCEMVSKLEYCIVDFDTGELIKAEITTDELMQRMEELGIKKEDCGIEVSPNGISGWAKDHILSKDDIAKAKGSTYQEFLDAHPDLTNHNHLTNRDKLRNLLSVILSITLERGHTLPKEELIQVLYRGEREMQTLNQERIDDDKSNKTTLHKGFTSISENKSSAKGFATGESATMNSVINPLVSTDSMNLSKLSYFGAGEAETLFSPGAEFNYNTKGSDPNLHQFTIMPMRTLHEISNKPVYNHVSSLLRMNLIELYDLCKVTNEKKANDYNDLIGYLDKPLKDKNRESDIGIIKTISFMRENYPGSSRKDSNSRLNVK